MLLKKYMWVLILLSIGVLYYFTINTVVWNLKNSFEYDSSKFKLEEVLDNENDKCELTIKYEYPLINLSKCKLKVYGSNINGNDKLLYLGAFNNKVSLTGLNTDCILSFHVINKNRLYIYGSKGEALKANSKQANVTLFLKHKNEFNGHYKIKY